MRHWMRRVLLGLALVALLVTAGVAYLIMSDTTTPVAVGDAVGRFREERESGDASTGAVAADGRPLPAEGVYVYATEGHDAIDVLGGSTHGYPGETTVTISYTACGLRQRWQPLEERWDEEEVCVSDAGRERRSLGTHHEFFSMSDDQTFTCASGYLLLPADPVPGATWSTSCDAAGTGLIGTGRVVGFDTRDVGGQEVETVHVRIDEEATGSNTGPSSDDYWFRTSDGLLIERASSVDTRSASPVGTATYSEAFTLRLVSLAPRR